MAARRPLYIAPRPKCCDGPRRSGRTAPGPARPSPNLLRCILAGRALVGGRLQPVEIAVGEDGRIHSIGRTRSGAPRHDVGDAVILPAATDLHVHLRGPDGKGGPEAMARSTLEAALGGVTLVGDMPNSDPPIDSVDRLESKEFAVRGHAAVDVLLYASPARPSTLESLARRAGGFKIFLSPTTGIEDTPSAAELEALLARLSGLGLPVSVHAEDPVRFHPEVPASDPLGWGMRRPPEAETAAVERLLAAPPALRLHVAHVTIPRTVETLRDRGVSFESTPQHLLLSARGGADARFKVNPPLRSEAERQALWASFVRGEIPCLASDHAPHPVEAKGLGFELAPSGMPGVETMLPLLLARVRANELPLATLVAAACERPARWLGQPLGRLAPGHRANFLVVDFRARTRVKADALAGAVGWSAFEGWESIRPREHWRDGQRIVDGGEYVGRPAGAVVRPEYAPAPPEAIWPHRTD